MKQKRHLGVSTHPMVRGFASEVFTKMRKLKENYNVKKWIIYPVSLLTAIGNDLGGGCYEGKTSHEEVGTWTYDLLSIEDEVPEGYKEKSVLFFQLRY